MWTDDPVRDFHQYDAMMVSRESKLPRCVFCGERIDDDYCFVDNDGIHCERCFNEKYRVPMDDILETE